MGEVAYGCETLVKRQCVDCLKYMPLSDFYKDGRGHPHRRCKACAGARQAMRRIARGYQKYVHVEPTTWKTEAPVVDEVANRFLRLRVP